MSEKIEGIERAYFSFTKYADGTGFQVNIKEIDRGRTGTLVIPANKWDEIRIYHNLQIAGIKCLKQSEITNKNSE